MNKLILALVASIACVSAAPFPSYPPYETSYEVDGEPVLTKSMLYSNRAHAPRHLHDMYEEEDSYVPLDRGEDLAFEDEEEEYLGDEVAASDALGDYRNFENELSQEHDFESYGGLQNEEVDGEYADELSESDDVAEAEGQEYSGDLAEQEYAEELPEEYADQEYLDEYAEEQTPSDEVYEDEEAY